jgi:cytochrome c peroxidase
MTDVFTGRMAGNAVTHSQDVSFGPWLERVPAPAPVPVTDAAAVARGLALFNSPTLGCTGCHSGPLMTTKALVNVGTGGTFKVPSLIGVGARPPYLHDGCAPTLADRFGSCGGGDLHGHTSQLVAQDISDLVAYLETL